VNILLKGLSNLHQLKSLNVSFDYDININYSIAKQLNKIATNCERLKHLELKLKTYELFQSYEIFDTFKHFKRLKKLVFRYNYVSQTTSLILKGLHFTSKALVDCHKLTHLTLSGCKITDIFFDGIDANLPNLEYLNISNAKITKPSFEAMSKLTHMQTMYLHLGDTFHITNIDTVIKMCDKIKFIDLMSYGFHLDLNDFKIDQIKQNTYSLNDMLRDKLYKFHQ